MHAKANSFSSVYSIETGLELYFGSDRHIECEPNRSLNSGNGGKDESDRKSNKSRAGPRRRGSKPSSYGVSCLRISRNQHLQMTKQNLLVAKSLCELGPKRINPKN